MRDNRNLTGFVKRNVWWVLLCVLITTGIFLFQPKAPPHNIDLIIPIVFEKTPPGLTLRHPLPQGIEISIQGPHSVLEVTSQNKLKYVIDLSGAVPGKKSVPVNPKNIPLPKGVIILKKSTEAIDFILDKEVKKQVPVIITLSGKPAQNYHVAGAIAKPASVVLRGPEHILAIIEKVNTKPIDISGLTDSFKKEISLDLPEHIRIAQQPGIILAEISMAVIIITRTFENIPVKGENAAHPFSITPSGITIEIKGPVNIIEKLQADKGIAVYVDLKGLKPGVYVRRSAITLPVETTLVSAKPELFTVKIQN